MGRKSSSGGATPKGADRIQLDFWFEKKRYRPTINQRPTATNLQHARSRVKDIKRRIELGTFVFADEFPEYKFIDGVAATGSRPTFNHYADLYLASIGGLAHATRVSYRKILAHFWRKKVGERILVDIKYAELAAIVGQEPWGSNKTRNNILSVGKRVFDFAYADLPDRRNPAEKLRSLKVQRRRPDPYAVEEAEKVISGIRKDWGADDADYVEFVFFSGLRPSEAIALTWTHTDLNQSAIRVERARVMGKDKDVTKTSEGRDVELNPRAWAVLKRRRSVSGLAGGPVFTQDKGRPWHDLQLQWRHWQYTHKRLKIRYREPYQMRHSSVTWNLMIGKNLLWVAEQHGHSPAVMLKTYAKWLKGTTEADIEAIRRAMGFATNSPLKVVK